MEEELRNSEEADRRKREEAERQKTLAETQSAVSDARTAAEEARNAAAEAQSAVKEAQLATWAQETAYPEPATQEPSPVEQVSTEPSSAEIGLQVKPPSTGEQVAADRPGRAAGRDSNSQASDTATSQSPSEPSLKIEPTSEERPSPESTAHHG